MASIAEKVFDLVKPNAEELGLSGQGLGGDRCPVIVIFDDILPGGVETLGICFAVRIGNGHFHFRCDFGIARLFQYADEAGIELGRKEKSSQGAAETLERRTA